MYKIISILILIIFSILFFTVLANADVKEYFITCDPDSFEYIYEHYEEDNYIPITLTYDGTTWEDIRMRIRGDTSREFPKKSLKVKFDNIPFSNGRYVLNFNAEYSDITYIHNFLASKLMRESGQPCFESEYARLYLNGEFLGLYLRVENIDEYFLNSQNLDLYGDLYKATLDGACLSIYDKMEYWELKINTSSYDNLENLIEEINIVSDEDYYDFAQETFDYNRMINIIAMNMLIANGSTCYHNYYMYNDINNTKKWIMFPWDMDKTFHNTVYGKNHSYQYSTGPTMNDNPFIERAIICEPIFEDIKDRVDELSNTIFNSTYLSPIIDSLYTLLIASVNEDTTDNIGDLVSWETSLDNEESYIEERYSYLQNQFNNYPYSFNVELTPYAFITTDDITFKWKPSIDPNGDNITYTLKYNTSPDFAAASTIIIDGITDTTYTLTNVPDIGYYYWRVLANDATNSIDGFDKKNRFKIKQGSILPPEINGNVVFNRDNSPYIAEGDIIVTANSSLTLEEGVEIRMAELASIFVYGEIHLEGSLERPVSIRSNVAGKRWRTLSCYQSTGTNTFYNVLIEDASEGIEWQIHRSAISGYESDLILDNVVFKNNIKSLTCNSGRLIVKNCIFDYSNTGEHLSALYCNGDVIENCEFYCNFSISHHDAIDLSYCVNDTVRGCKFFDGGDDAIDLDGGVDFVIINNEIYNFGDKGIGVNAGATARIENNLIVNCSKGISPRDNGSAYINQNTFFGNDIAIKCYNTPSVSNDGGNAEIINCIFANSQTNVLSIDSLSSCIVSYSLCDTEILPGDGNANIMADPKFISIADNDFNLKDTSPCINKGNPNSPLDPDGTRADIGAYYFNLLQSSQIIISEINYNSSEEFDPGDWIEFYNPPAYNDNNSVDISDWYFKDENDEHIFTFPANTILEANKCIVLCRDTVSFSNLFPDVNNYIGDFDFGLSGNGELLRLFNSIGNIIDSLIYDDELPWPLEPDGNGPTLELINPYLDNAKSQSWIASANYGTPGLADTSADEGEEEPAIIYEYALMQNYPNPFNARTEIHFVLPYENFVKLNIYNVRGQLVRTLINNKYNAGYHIIKWDGANNNSKIVASGIYFYRLETDDYIETRAMVMLK